MLIYSQEKLFDNSRYNRWSCNWR